MQVKDLAQALAERKRKSREEQYAILLGKACARAAGNPYETVAGRIPGAISRYLPNLTSLIHGKNIDSLLDSVPDDNRATVQKTLHRMLQQYYVSLPVPLFYQDLAAIIKAGYFSRVLTTNYDNLLEQALESPPTPLRRDRDFSVVNVPVLTKEKVKERLHSAGSQLLILKLQGDLQEQGSNFDLAELQEALIEHRKSIYGELSNDLVVAGYERESPAVDNALHAQSGGTIWWVSEKGIDPSLQASLAPIRAVQVIEGPYSSPDQFFSALCTTLLRTSDTAEAGEAETPAGGAPDPDAAALLLADQLSRARDELDRLRRSAVPGANQAVETQIEYQEQQIAKLEDQLRLQKKQDILLLLDRILASSKSAGVDTETLTFLNEQADTVRQSFNAATPNQAVISAALTAISVLARRLGRPAVESGTAQELAAYAPSAAGRGA